MALAMVAALSLPVGALAQGLFQRGVTDEVYYGFGGQGIVQNKSAGDATGLFTNQHFGTPIGGNDITNQNFGGIFVRPDDITNQTFGAPLGSGVLVLLAVGAGYTSIKSRNKKQEKVRRQSK